MGVFDLYDLGLDNGFQIGHQSTEIKIKIDKLDFFTI